MSLPHLAQPIAEMRARYEAALVALYDHADARTFADPPSKKREHVFDYEDGLRLIVSREKDEMGVTGIHLSASAELSGRLMQRALGRFTDLASTAKWFTDAALARFRELSGETGFALFLGFSNMGVPHWMLVPTHAAFGPMAEAYGKTH